MEDETNKCRRGVTSTNCQTNSGHLAASRMWSVLSIGRAAVSKVPSCRRNALETLKNEMVQSCRPADRKYEGDARTYQRGLKIGPPEKEKKGHEKGRLLQG